MSAPAWPFAKLGERPRGVEHKTCRSDVFEWGGLWKGRPVRFTTRWRLADPSVFFHTHSNARIDFDRDLGAQYLDLHVHGWMSDAELRELEALASTAGGGCVVVARCNNPRTTPRHQPPAQDGLL